MTLIILALPTKQKHYLKFWHSHFQHKTSGFKIIKGYYTFLPISSHQLTLSSKIVLVTENWFPKCAVSHFETSHLLKEEVHLPGTEEEVLLPSFGNFGTSFPFHSKAQIYSFIPIKAF